MQRSTEEQRKWRMVLTAALLLTWLALRADTSAPVRDGLRDFLVAQGACTYAALSSGDAATASATVARIRSAASGATGRPASARASASNPQSPLCAVSWTT